ncbi:Prepilin-type N-terminal cleavage/methylation domain-containing protein [Candidatus Electronema halotolerans]
MRMSTAGSCEHGFTLVELIVVMVLISLTAAFAMPNIRSSLFADELKSAARRFVGLATEAAQEARQQRTAVLLRFDQDEHRFTAAPAGTEGMISEKQYGQVRLAASVEVTDIDAAHREANPDLTILFDQRGYTDRTAVHFRQDNGDELTVLLSPFLGLARIVEGHVSLDDDRILLEQ